MRFLGIQSVANRIVERFREPEAYSVYGILSLIALPSGIGVVLYHIACAIGRVDHLALGAFHLPEPSLPLTIMAGVAALIGRFTLMHLNHPGSVGDFIVNLFTGYYTWEALATLCGVSSLTLFILRPQDESMTHTLVIVGGALIAVAGLVIAFWPKARERLRT